MTPTLAEFLAWLEQTPRCIPTLPDQADLPPAELIPVWNPNHEVQSGFGIVYEADGGTIHTIAGNQCSFDVSDAGQTWTRFFGLMQTTARNVGFHGAVLAQPHAHRMPGSYNQPPQLMGPSNLHGWPDCPNNRVCPFLAATIRAFLLNTLPANHPLYQWV